MKKRASKKSRTTKTSDGRVTIEVELPDDLIEEVRVMAEKEGRSISSQLTFILESYLQDDSFLELLREPVRKRRE